MDEVGEYATLGEKLCLDSPRAAIFDFVVATPTVAPSTGDQ